MEQLTIVATLKPGMEDEARRLIEHGPPFDIAGSGLRRHAVYLSAAEVVFVFEGHEVEWIVDAMVQDFFRPELTDAFAAWRPLLRGEPRIARPAFVWERVGADDG